MFMSIELVSPCRLPLSLFYTDSFLPLFSYGRTWPWFIPKQLLSIHNVNTCGSQIVLQNYILTNH